MIRRRHATGFLTLLIFAAGCTAPRQTGDAGGREAPAGPVTRTVQGYRIQILNTPERETAYAELEDAMAWWEGVPSHRRPAYLGGGELDVDVAWRAPTYRVRVGRFATRSEAERALSVVAEAYPDAFIVPETVTVTR